MVLLVLLVLLEALEALVEQVVRVELAHMSPKEIMVLAEHQHLVLQTITMLPPM